MKKTFLSLLILAVVAIVVISGCVEYTEEQSKQIAQQFVQSSPTYQFDGYGLVHNVTYTARCPQCWLFVFKFESPQAGYGDRTGLELAQVITPHTAYVMVEKGVVKSAIMDNRWDMLKQELIEASGEAITRELCESAGGYWDDCTNICELLNQGKPDVLCPQVCETFCICSGIAGFRCPEGYTCKILAESVVDAVGYCVPEKYEEMTIEEALEIAQNSGCVQQGNLSSNYVYNEYTKTWWIDLDIEKEGCSPACVIDVVERTAEINWRCTGLLE